MPFWSHGDLAVVGLGAGAMAAYAHPGQRMVFLEIDPDVVRIARDIGHFSYLARSLGRIEVRVGDGLATLNAAQGEQFQLIIVDAYDENSVPDHLVSADALATYTARLAPGGAVVLAATETSVSGGENARPFSIISARMCARSVDACPET